MPAWSHNSGRWRGQIFHTAAEDFDAGQRRWDCVLFFNQMLYHPAARLALVRRYAELRRPDGLLVI